MERGHGMGELRSMISKETGKNGNLFPICAAGIKMQSHRRLTFLRSNPQQRRCGAVVMVVLVAVVVVAALSFRHSPYSKGHGPVPSLPACLFYLAAAILSDGVLAFRISCQSVAPTGEGKEKFSRAFLPRA